jgi:CheY-like chemotaxis protein
MPSGPTACVLLVDDDDTIAAAMAMLLRVSGHRAVVADSGARAHALVDGGVDPRVIVMDYQLGVHGPDGLEVLRTLRARLERTVPAIVTTGDVSGALEPLVAGLPACTLLVKPFDPQAFVDRVEALLAGT